MDHWADAQEPQKNPVLWPCIQWHVGTTFSRYIKNILLLLFTHVSSALSQAVSSLSTPTADGQAPGTLSLQQI